MKDEKKKHPVFTLVDYDSIYTLAQLATEMHLEHRAMKGLHQPQGSIQADIDFVALANTVMNNHKLDIEMKEEDKNGKQHLVCPLRRVHYSMKETKLMNKHA